MKDNERLPKNVSETFWQRINKKWFILIGILLLPFVLAGICILIAAIIKFGAVADTFGDLAEYAALFGFWFSPIVLFLSIAIYFISKRKTYAWLTCLFIALFTLFPLTVNKLFYRTLNDLGLNAQFHNFILYTGQTLMFISFFAWPIFLAISLIKYVRIINQQKIWKILIIILTVLIELFQAMFLMYLILSSFN